ncbi:MAG: hypothetical protein ACLFPR_11925, partial [Desulfococcaceae bacterium]
CTVEQWKSKTVFQLLPSPSGAKVELWPFILTRSPSSATARTGSSIGFYVPQTCFEKLRGIGLPHENDCLGFDCRIFDIPFTKRFVSLRRKMAFPSINALFPPPPKKWRPCLRKIASSKEHVERISINFNPGSG